MSPRTPLEVMAAAPSRLMLAPNLLKMKPSLLAFVVARSPVRLMIAAKVFVRIAPAIVGHIFGDHIVIRCTYLA